jgi:hypothetical protein
VACIVFLISEVVTNSVPLHYFEVRFEIYFNLYLTNNLSFPSITLRSDLKSIHKSTLLFIYYNFEVRFKMYFILYSSTNLCTAITNSVPLHYFEVRLEMHS